MLSVTVRVGVAEVGEKIQQRIWNGCKTVAEAADVGNPAAAAVVAGDNTAGENAGRVVFGTVQIGFESGSVLVAVVGWVPSRRMMKGLGISVHRSLRQT